MPSLLPLPKQDAPLSDAANQVPTKPWYDWLVRLQRALTTALQIPLIVGGPNADSTLTLESTSGAGTSDTITFKTGSQVERMRVDTNGFVTIGGIPNNQSHVLEVHNASGADTQGIFNWDAVSSHFGALRFFKAPSGTKGTQGAVSSGYGLGALDFRGSDGTDFQTAAGIDSYCDGVVTAGNVPGRIVFYTTPPGSAIAECMRVDSLGRVGISTTGQTPSANLHVATSTVGATPTIRCEQTSASTGFAEVQAKSNSGTNILGMQSSSSGASAYVGPVAAAIPLGLWTNSNERVRIDSGGAVYLISVGTTASAANAFINNASSPANSILRSTSSLRYKTDISEIPAQRLAALRDLKPIEYRSLASADDPETRFVGYAAEDVAAIDPALVARDEEGHPDGVMYDRVLLLQVAALKAEIEELKAGLSR